METRKLFTVFRNAIFLSTIMLLTAMNGCKKAAEKTNEKLIEESIGGDAKVDIDDQKVVIETDEGTFTTDANVHSWPTDIPDAVPEFKKGKVMGATTQTMEGTNNWMILFETVPNEALEDYKKQLENAGFAISFTTVTGSGGQLAAERDDLSVMLMMGDGNATITVSQNE